MKAALKVIAFALVASLILPVITPLHAECDSSPDPKCGENMNMGIYSFVGVLAGAAVSTGIGITLTTRNKSADDKVAYLKKNSEELSKHLSVGRGKTLDDVIHLFDVKSADELKAKEALRLHRVGLVSALQSSQLSMDDKTSRFERVLATR